MARLPGDAHEADEPGYGYPPTVDEAKRIVKEFLDIALRDESGDVRATQEESRRMELAPRMWQAGVEWVYTRDRFGRRLVSHYTGQNPQNLIAAARKGDTQAHEALIEIVRRQARRGKPVPPLLQEYVVTPRKGTRGRPKGKVDRVQDRLIAGAALKLSEMHGFKPFLGGREGSKDRSSVCSIVAEVLLQEFGINRTKEAIAKIAAAVRAEAEGSPFPNEGIADKKMGV
jgi:hypothetical protein